MNKRNVLEWVRAEDYVEYRLYPKVDTSNISIQQSTLNKQKTDIEQFINKYTKDYIWHKDLFKLTVRTAIDNELIEESNNQLPPHLYGVTHFGENIEDEWFIVFLLMEISKHFKDLPIQITDNDGEFLLIESADYLPDWVKPETSENRVYILNGQVHLIPHSDYQMTVIEALQTIRNDPTLTLTTNDIQECISNRIRDYPRKIQDNLHRTNVYLPIGVATILANRPELIAPAVRVFCNRDPIDMKACRAMKYFPPETRVMSRITFTKHLYAMLCHSRYVPDRITGWNLPNTNNTHYKAHNLGVRIACGFEILMSQTKSDTPIEDRGWSDYLQTLKSKNYFKDYLEHSKPYNELMDKAKDYYKVHRDSMCYTSEIANEIKTLYDTLDFKIDESKANEKTLPPDDDESWLNVSPDELDKMLQTRYGTKNMTKINENSDANDFGETLTNFLNNVSDLDGVEYPVRPPRGIKPKNKVSFAKDTKTEEKKATNKINFDPNGFACAVQNILNFVIPDDDGWNSDSDSDMSDYADDREGHDKNDIEKYMEEMDKELAATTIGESFEKKKMNGDSFDDIETFQPVDIDVNALKNILESYRSQLGDAGPSSNMLGPMGISLDVDGKKN